MWALGDLVVHLTLMGPQAMWRSCAVMLDGLLINGPLLHYAYEMLEKCLPTGESVWAAVMQVIPH